MPGTDLDLDSLSHDFVDTANGDDWVEVDHIGPQVQHQILDDRGRFFADLDAGNEAWKIPKKGDRATALRLEDAHREALSVFIRLGLAEDLDLEFGVDQEGRLAWQGSMVDLQHGQLDLTPLLTYGVEG